MMACAAVVFSPAAPGYGQGQAKAGRIAAELPVGNIERAGQSQVAVINMDILWEDVVRTSDRGRVRVTLDDSSILNIGSNSVFRVVRHEAQTRQTELEMTVGKARMRLQRLGPGQQFQIKTSTAVIGAVGTDFFVEATPQFTRVIVFEGAVIVSGLAAAAAASQTVLAGNQTSVFSGQPPSPPQPASRADMQQSEDDTDVGPALPPPPPPTAKKAGLPALLKNKWFWIAAGAATAVTVGVVVGTRGPRQVTGCPVPSASSAPSSSVSISAATCPP